MAFPGSNEVDFENSTSWSNAINGLGLEDIPSVSSLLSESQEHGPVSLPLPTPATREQRSVSLSVSSVSTSSRKPSSRRASGSSVHHHHHHHRSGIKNRNSNISIVPQEDPLLQRSSSSSTSPATPFHLRTSSSSTPHLSLEEAAMMMEVRYQTASPATLELTHAFSTLDPFAPSPLPSPNSGVFSSSRGYASGGLQGNASDSPRALASMRRGASPHLDQRLNVSALTFDDSAVDVEYQHQAAVSSSFLVRRSLSRDSPISAGAGPVATAHPDFQHHLFAHHQDSSVSNTILDTGHLLPPGHQPGWASLEASFLAGAGGGQEASAFSHSSDRSSDASSFGKPPERKRLRLDNLGKGPKYCDTSNLSSSDVMPRRSASSAMSDSISGTRLRFLEMGVPVGALDQFDFASRSGASFDVDEHDFRRSSFDVQVPSDFQEPVGFRRSSFEVRELSVWDQEPPAVGGLKRTSSRMLFESPERPEDHELAAARRAVDGTELVFEGGPGDSGFSPPERSESVPPMPRGESSPLFSHDMAPHQPLLEPLHHLRAPGDGSEVVKAVPLLRRPNRPRLTTSHPIISGKELAILLKRRIQCSDDVMTGTDNGDSLSTGELVLADSQAFHTRRFHPLDTGGSLTIIDCRFPYEYDGGHIEGAINVNTHEELARLFFGGAGAPPMSPSRRSGVDMIVFHCEFSSHRGPNMAANLRRHDRLVHRYPDLSFPDVFILAGGYCDFVAQFPSLCTRSGGYISMFDPKFAVEMKKGLSMTEDRVGRKKLGRSRTGQGAVHRLGSSAGSADFLDSWHPSAVGAGPPQATFADAGLTLSADQAGGALPPHPAAMRRASSSMDH